MQAIKPVLSRFFILLSFLPGLLLFSGVAYVAVGPETGVAAEKDAAEQKKKRRTRKTPSLSQTVYKKLTKAQELIEDKRYEDGLAALQAIEKEPKLTAYERAQLYNYFAYTYFTMERFKDAIASYEKVLAQPDLPEALEQNSLYTLAQLYFIIEEYPRAIEIINQWFSVIPEPTVNAYILLGQGYYQMEEYKDALVPLRQAYNMTKERAAKPKENLLLLMRVVYFQLDDFPSMVEVLTELVSLYPKPEYWLTLAGAYSELKYYEKQLSIMEMLYERNELPRGSQRLNLANLYLLHDIPYKAAVLIEKGMEEEVIEKNVRNLRLLSQAWVQAQEDKRSIAPLKQAAGMSKDGELDMRLGQAYLNLDRYKEAAESLAKAIEKGDLKDTGQAYILKGLAEFELEKFQSAIRSFQVAAENKDKKTRRSAETWLDYVRNEVQRKKQLEEAFASTTVRR